MDFPEVSMDKAKQETFWLFVREYDRFEAIERLAQGNPEDDWMKEYQRSRKRLKDLRSDLEDHETHEVRA